LLAVAAVDNSTPSAWALSRSALIAEHGADRAVPLGPHLDHLARSLGSYTNSDTPVGMPFSSV